MKRLLLTIILTTTMLAQVVALPYEEARERARYLTDKMAYELNLTDAQYNDAYEINLDYLMSINTERDLGGVYLEYRNADMRCILHDWQYTLFAAADYFFRPILWYTNRWYYPVYHRYGMSVYYNRPPRVYHDYRGGHCGYRFTHHVSYYHNRRPPVPHHTAAPGFRFERPAHSRPATHQPAHPQGSPGFRIGNTAPQRHTHAPARREAAATYPAGVRNVNNSMRDSRGPGMAPQDVRQRPTHNTNSRYNRPSSTRSTVGRQSAGTQRRSTATRPAPSTSRKAGARSSTPQRASAARL